MAARHYVYELANADGVQYVGKGSGRRLEAQKRRFGLDGRVVRWFDSAAKAYSFEKVHIAAVRPALNKCAGGNGSRNKIERKPKWVQQIEEIGSRVYAARLLLQYEWMLEPSKLEQIRRVAHG